MSLLNNISSKLSGIPTTQKMLAVAVVTALTIGGGAATYIANSDANSGYVSLISSKNSADIPKAITQLDIKDIKYRITSNGDLLVSEKDIIPARNVLAKDGQLFSSKTGYDLLNKEQSIFINSTQQQLLKTQVIEENLQLTLEQIEGVQAAKVHLSLSETSDFMRDTNKSTASIMLELEPGKQLSDAQVRSIANLVSSSVPYLSPNDVVITDQYAQQLSGDSEDNYAMNISQVRYKTKLEGKLHANIMQVIAPLIGLQNMRVSVNADINYDKIKNTKEEYLKDPKTIQSEQLEYNYDDSRDGAGKGVPGALSNQPPGHVKLSAKDKNSENSGNASAISHEKIKRNYSIGRSVTNTEYGGMALRKIDVVVLIDRKTLEDDFVYDTALIKLPDAPLAPVKPTEPKEPDFIAKTKPAKMNEDQRLIYEQYDKDKEQYKADLVKYNAALTVYTPLKAQYDKEVKTLTNAYNEKNTANRKIALAAFIKQRTLNIESMTRGAAGFDKARGDTVTVITDSFIPRQSLKKLEPVKADAGKTSFQLKDYSLIAISVLVALIVLLLGVLFVRRKNKAKTKNDSNTEEQDQNIQDILGDVMKNDGYIKRSEDEIAKTMTRDQLDQDNLNADDVDLESLIEIAKDNLREKQKPALIVLSEWLDNRTDLQNSIIAEIKDNNGIVRISKAGDADSELFVSPDEFSDDFDIDSLIEKTQRPHQEMP